MNSLCKTCRGVGLVALVGLAMLGKVRGADFVQARLDGITDTGNVMAYVLPITALGFTGYFKDGEGFKEFAESATITMGITVALKYSINSRRPNGDPHSFPSGHAAITFSSAEFLRKRYGWKIGVPAYLLASFVGYSRVRAHEHYFRDVAAGAAIAVTTTYIETTPYKEWHVEPKVTSNYFGLRVSRGFLAAPRVTDGADQPPNPVPTNQA